MQDIPAKRLSFQHFKMILFSKQLFVIAFSFLAYMSLNAQNSSHHWAIGGGVNFVKYAQKSYIPAGQIWIGRRMNETLSFNTYFLYSHQITFPFSVSSDNSNNQANLYDGGVLFQLNSDNGIFFRQSAKISPFIVTGLGGNFVPLNSDIYFQLGGGLKLKWGDRWQTQLGATQKFSLNKTPEHSCFYLNMLYCFGKVQPFVYPDYVLTSTNPNQPQPDVKISDIDAPPKSGDSRKDEMLEKMWVVKSSLFADEEKLEILRENRKVLRDSIHKIADSLAALRYHVNLDSVYSAWGGINKLKQYLLDTTITAIPTTLIAPEPAKSAVAKPSEEELSMEDVVKFDSLTDANLDCFDLRKKIFWIDFLPNSEEAEENALSKLQQIAELMQKCQVLKLTIFDMMGNQEKEDASMSERRRDYARLYLSFGYKVEGDRIRDQIRPTASQNEYLTKLGWMSTETGRVYLIFR